MEHNEEQREGNSLTGIALNLGDLVAYQEGSVVSSTIIAKNTGTATIFAFAKG